MKDNILTLARAWSRHARDFSRYEKEADLDRLGELSRELERIGQALTEGVDFFRAVSDMRPEDVEHYRQVGRELSAAMRKASTALQSGSFAVEGMVAALGRLYGLVRQRPASPDR